MAAILGELGWPAGLPTEALVASVYDRAMRSGIFESELILGYAHDRAEFPASASREDRLTVAMYALCRFADSAVHARPVRGDPAGVGQGQGRADGRLGNAEAVPRFTVIAPR